jgi:hypothetical protein
MKRGREDFISNYDSKATLRTIRVSAKAGQKHQKHKLLFVRHIVRLAPKILHFLLSFDSGRPAFLTIFASSRLGNVDGRPG